MPRRQVRSVSLEVLEVRQLLSASPFISEFLASNSKGLQDKDGAYSDWVEVSNPSGTAANLNGWYLTDDASNLKKWQFPNVSIAPGSSIVVFASDKNLANPTGELHTNFKLSAGGEFLGLVQPDGTTIVSQYAPTFPAQTNDISYGYVPVASNLLTSGAAGRSLVPTTSTLEQTWTAPGFDDSGWSSVTTGVGFKPDGSFDAFIGSNLQTAMLNTNSTAYVRVPFQISDLTQVDALLLSMRYDDGFVAYINGTEVARKNAPTTLKWNSAATNSLENPPVIEKFDLSGKLASLVQGTNILAIQGLNDSAAGSDFLIAPELQAYNLHVGPPAYLQAPTPGGINLAAAVTQVAEVRFSQQRGFYDAPFDLTIASDTTGATIRYTLDGSLPTTTNGQVYQGPIRVGSTATVRAIAYKSGMQTTSVGTQTYLFLDDVLRQPATIAGYPNETVDVGNNHTVVNDYAMDPNIVNDTAYSQAIKVGLKSIPTMAISVSLADMYGPSGFYSGESEKPASIEIIDPNDPSQSLQVNGGIEPHSHNRLKRSLRLSFKSEYGPSKLISDLLQRAPLNGESASNTLDNIVLRAGNNRAWTRDWNPDATAFTEDQWYRDTQLAMSGIGSHGSFVHLYINGVYWGLYNPAERPDEDFSDEYLGGSSADWFSTNHDNRVRGDSTRWDYLTGPLLAKDLTDPVNYQEFQQYLDVKNYSDYLLLNFYQAETDWPTNNFYVGMRTDTQGPARFYAWDGEWSWDRGFNNAPVNGAWVHPAFRNNSTSTATIANLWRAAKVNSDFMTNFADRAYHHLYNNGALSEQNSIARWQTLNNYIRDAVVAESARWGDALSSLGQSTRTRDGDWQQQVDKITGIMQGNVPRMIAALRSEGFYPSIDVPQFSQRGGTVVARSVVQLTLPAGATDIYYTLDGSDPRAAGGSVSATAVRYSNGIRLTDSATLRVRAIQGSEWSALDEAQFTVVPAGPNQPPVVSAGSTQNVTLPSGVTLQGTVQDDGQPNDTPTTEWQKLSGPGEVTFANSADPSTSATFSVAGSYVLRLSAFDGEFTAFQDVTITVNPAATFAVESLSLMSADTNLPIPGYETMSSGSEINLATLPTRRLNVRANTVGNLGSVRFGLNSASNFKTESTAPYALFGDVNGTFNAGQFDVGSYTLSATPFSASGGGGTAGTVLSINFVVVDRPLQNNQPPVVSAGSNQSVTLPAQATLAGSASDDGLPSNTLTTIWQKLSGPGVVTFSDDTRVDATASFSVAGNYVLRLTASDGQLSSYSDVAISVASTPASSTVTALALINAVTDQPIPGFEALTNGMTLNLATLPTTKLNVDARTAGTVGSVRFGLNGNPNYKTESTAPFSLFGDNNGDFLPGSFAVGSYTLTATPYASAGAKGAVGQLLSVSFTVIDQPVTSNQPPTVNAGADQRITHPAVANLVGTASDDGLPNNALSATWQKLSGPGDVTIGDASQLQTTASFTTPGSYVLRLTVSDGELSSTDDVTIDVLNSSVTQVDTFNPTDDAFLQDGTRYNNKLLRVETTPARNRVSYLKFDVSVPAGKAVDSAILRLVIKGDPGFGNLRILQGSHSNWTQTKLTAANAPTSTGVLATKSGPYALNQVVEFDLTSAITSSGKITLLIDMEAGGNSIAFSSKEGLAPPQLIVTSSDVAAPPAPSFYRNAGNPLVEGEAWSNPDYAYDVNGSGLLEPLDVLLVINAINQQSQGEGSGGPLAWYTQRRFAFLDVSGDGRLSALDALLVINEINAGRTTWVSLGGDEQPVFEAEGEWEATLGQSGVPDWQDVRKRTTAAELPARSVDAYFAIYGRR